MVVLADFVVEPGDGEDVVDLLRVPAGAATLADLAPPFPQWRPPYDVRATPDGQDEDEEPADRPQRTFVSEAAILEAPVHKSKDQPRWPAGTPGGKGGQWVETGQTFMAGGRKWQVAHIVKGTIYAHDASAKYGQVETRAFKVVKGRDGKTTFGAGQYVPPTKVPKGGKHEDSEIPIVDPYVDPSTHDPSIPIPAKSALTPEQWKRFGKVDQEHYTELMERFGAHKPGAAKAHIDASYQAYQAKVQQMVKTGYKDQYGASTGFTLSLAAGGHVQDTPEMAKLREEALALQAEHRAAVQWDLYNRTLSPDLFAVHKSKSWSAQKWHDHAIKGEKPVFSGISQSWSYRAHFFGKHAIATPLAIRHILLSSHSAQPVPGESHFPGELEISVPEQLKLDSRSLAFSIPGVNPGGPDGVQLTPTQSQWLEGVTNQPMGGELLDTLRDSIENGNKLPTPPAPANLVMDSANGQTWADPPAAAAKVLPSEKLPSVQSAAIDPASLDKSLPWQHVDENGVPKAVTGEEAGVKAGQYFMGLKGTLYWVGNDPGNKTGYPYRIHKIENGAFNGENFAYNADYPGYYLDAVHEEVLAKPEDAPEFDASKWVNGTDAEFLEDFEQGDKFKLNGAVYEVTGPLTPKGVPVKDLESGLTGKINGNYKSVKLVPKGSAEAALVGSPEDALKPTFSEGMAVSTPDGHGVLAQHHGGGVWQVQLSATGELTDLNESALSPWAQPQQPKVGMTFPYEADGEVKKATVTVLKANGDVQANLAPGKVVIPADEWGQYADKTFDPGAWNIAKDPVKLRDMKPGDKFQGGSGSQTLRPYEVLAVPSQGKVTVRNMDTGQVSQMSRNVSYRPLELKPEPGSAAEGAINTPDAPPVSASTPVDTDLASSVNTANLTKAPVKTPPSELRPGQVIGPVEPNFVVTAADSDGVKLKLLSSGAEFEFGFDELTAPQQTWIVKGDKPATDLTPDPPAPTAAGKKLVEVDGSKFTEGELAKIGEMKPGTVFKTVSKKKGPTYYKISDDGQHSVNLTTGKSYPIKGGWKATVMQPADEPAGVPGTDGPFVASQWKEPDAPVPFEDAPVGAFIVNKNGGLADGVVYKKINDAEAEAVATYTGDPEIAAEEKSLGPMPKTAGSWAVLEPADVPGGSGGELGPPDFEGNQHKVGDAVTVNGPDGAEPGKVAGITPDGYSVTTDWDGETHDYLAGDVAGGQDMPSVSVATPTVHQVGDQVTVDSPNSWVHGQTGTIEHVWTEGENGLPVYKVKVPGHSAVWLEADEVTGAGGQQDPAPSLPEGKIAHTSLKGKPGALFEHEGVTMSVAGDQSVAGDDELIGIAPDGKAWLVTPEAASAGVLPLPGKGSAHQWDEGNTAVYEGKLYTVQAINASSADDLPGGSVTITPVDGGSTLDVNGALLSPLLPTDAQPGDKVEAFWPGGGSLGEPKTFTGHIDKVLPNGNIMLHGSTLAHKPENVKVLKAYPFQPGDKVQTADGQLGTFVGFETGSNGLAQAVYVDGLGSEVPVDPDSLGLASVDVPDPVGVVMEPKADKAVPYDELKPGDPTSVKTLQPGDQYFPVGASSSHVGDTPWVVVKAPESDQDVAKVQMLAPNGEPSGTVYDLYPDAPVQLKAKAAAAAAAPKPVQHAVDYDALPDASDHGFVGYKSHKGSGGKWSHHMVKTMPEGTVFADLNGKQWKVKQAGAKPIITDGESLFKIDGGLRGKDLNQPAVKQNPTLVDNSPPVGWVPGEDVPSASGMLPNDKTFGELDLQPGDRFKYGTAGTFTVTGKLGTGQVVTMATQDDTDVVWSFNPGDHPDHVSAAALAKPPTPAEPAPDAAPSPAVTPTLFTAPTTADQLQPGDQFTLAPGSGQVYTVTGSNALGVGYEWPDGDGGTLSSGMGSQTTVYTEPGAPGVPEQPSSVDVPQPVDPASVTAINDPDEFADVPPVPEGLAPTPNSPEPGVPKPDPPLQGFASRLGPGGVYRHDKLKELQVGQLFTDKTGTDYQLVSHGEGVAYYKNVATGAVMEAKNDLRVKRTALPPDPGPQVSAALEQVQAKYGGLDSVPTATVTGYSSATGEGGKVKYPRMGHLKTGEQVIAADGTEFVYMTSWLDKSLVYMGDGEWRIIPAATRVKRATT